MSYRAFKRLLGETSLERKCRFLFGAGILLLISGSFWLYAYQTEDLAYAQTTTACRVLVNPMFYKFHIPFLRKLQTEGGTVELLVEMATATGPEFSFSLSPRLLSLLAGAGVSLLLDVRPRPQSAIRRLAG